jgi:RNA polymerase sigma-70 factor (ECF subfamily)
VHRSIEEIARVEGGRVVATLMRLTGRLELAEDTYGDAVVEALRRWPRDGVPERPGAWLTTVARRKALDVLRREGQREAREQLAATALEDDEPMTWHTVRDDQLRLIFTCCHPALSPDARVALALRVLCSLGTAEIAHAFLVPEPTMGKRISRAKAKIAANRIPYRVPPDHELPERLAAVLAVVGVVFTTGHHAPTGALLQRVDLADEGIRLARLLVDLMPDEPECIGLLALLEATHARRATRVDIDGRLVLLSDADRTRWDRDAIDHAVGLVERSLRMGRPGPWQIQAAISCLHSVAPDVASTDWAQIVELYRMLEVLQPSVPVRVNHAVAIAEVDGPSAALLALDRIDGADGWHLFHAARAEMLARVGRPEASARSLRRALECPHNDVDGAFLVSRLEGA